MVCWEGFMACVGNLMIVGWSLGVQLTWCVIHQTWRSIYVGMKKIPTISGLTILQIIWWYIRNNNCNSFYDIYCRLKYLWVTSRGWKSLYRLYQWMLEFWHYTYDRGSLWFKGVFVYLCYWQYMSIFFTHTYYHFYSIIEIGRVSLDFINK